jgi:acyl-CoA thioesterase-1
MSRRHLALLVASVITAAAPATAAALSERCVGPPDLTQLHGKLPRVGLRMAQHEPLTIVALGSSSTEGIGASAPDKTYPAQLGAELHRRLPAVAVTVVNKGVGGETAGEMLARFDRDVFAERPDLVIWQVGTNSVLDDAATAPHEEIVRHGLDRLRAAGIDVVLMDQQYAPAVLAHPHYQAMERSLARLAKENGVPLFRRFALMQHWVEADQLDFSAMLSADGLHQNDASYACIGQLLGDAVVEAALPPGISHVAAARVPGPVNAKTASHP